MKAYLYNKLKNYYPDMQISNLNRDHITLYQYLCKYSKEKESSVQQTLEEMGFTYIKNKTGVGTNFDFKNASRLYSEFGVSQTELGNYLGISRQAVSENIKRNVLGTSWESTELDDEEVELIYNMVNSQVAQIEEEGLVVSIRNNLKDVCIIIVKDNDIKVVFELQEEIKEFLKENNYHVLTTVDFEIKRNLLPVTVFGKKMAKVRDQLTRLKIAHQCKLRNIDTNEYCKILGYEGHCNGRMMTDDEVVSIIEKYVTKENFVFLPHTSKDYYNLVNRAARSNMSIDEYFEFFGYIKVDSRLESNYLNKIEQLKSEINKYIVGDENHVYIPTDSVLYKKLYPFAHRRGISFDNLIAELGYKRVLKLDNNLVSNRPKTEIQEIIEELELVQGKLDKARTDTERLIRSKVLVTKLRRLYNYRCQFCNHEQGIPPIEKLDGTYYVEVHHITALSTLNNLQELDIDEKTLDTFRNAVVVCPYHHKVLHFHEGGFKNYIKDLDGIYFVSEKGTTLKLQYNYHL